MHSKPVPRIKSRGWNFWTVACSNNIKCILSRMSVKNLTRVVNRNMSGNLTSATMTARSLLSARCGTRAGGREATLPWFSPAHTNWQGRVVEIGEKNIYTSLQTGSPWQLSGAQLPKVCSQGLAHQLHLKGASNIKLSI